MVHTRSNIRKEGVDCSASNESTLIFHKHDVSPRKRKSLTGVGHSQYITKETRENVRENVKSDEFIRISMITF